MKVKYADIKINFDVDKALKQLDSIVKDVDGVLNRAVNRAVYKTRTELTRKTVEKYFIKRGVIMEHTKIFTAQGRDHNAKILYTGKRLDLAKYYKFQPKRSIYGTRQKYYYGAVKRAGGLKKFEFRNVNYSLNSRAAFYWKKDNFNLALMPGVIDGQALDTVIRRAHEGYYGADAHIFKNKYGFLTLHMKRRNVKVRKLKGPSIPQIIKNPETVEYAMKAGGLEFEKRLQHEITQAMRKALKIKGGQQLILF